jgi:hypothetical protein
MVVGLGCSQSYFFSWIRCRLGFRRFADAFVYVETVPGWLVIDLIVLIRAVKRRTVHVLG